MKQLLFSFVSFFILACVESSCRNSGGAVAATDSVNAVPARTGAAMSKPTSVVSANTETGGLANNLTTSDREFITRTASSSMLQISLGSLAGSMASSQRVRKFADTMVAHHKALNDKLKYVAGQLQLSFPTSMLSEDLHRQEKLESKKDISFDKSFMQMMVDDHKSAIQAFSKAAKSRNTLIKNFASQMLPILTVHLDSANVISKKINR